MPPPTWATTSARRPTASVQRHQRRYGPIRPRSTPLIQQMLLDQEPTVRRVVQHNFEVIHPRRSASKHPVAERLCPFARRGGQDAGPAAETVYHHQSPGQRPGLYECGAPTERNGPQLLGDDRFIWPDFALQRERRLIVRPDDGLLRGDRPETQHQRAGRSAAERHLCRF